MRTYITAGLIILLCMTLICSCSSNCDDKMGDTRGRYGSPEEVSSYSNDGYNSVDWWYWTKGIEFTFTWGSGVDGCKVSTYTFEPIGTVVTDAARTHAEETKTLESTITYPNCRIFD